MRTAPDHIAQQPGLSRTEDATDAPLPERLLDAAESLAVCGQVDALAQAVLNSIRSLEGARIGGLAVLDEERHFVGLHLARMDDAGEAPAFLELELAARNRRPDHSDLAALGLDPAAESRLREELTAAGAREIHVVPVQLSGDLLGHLVVGFDRVPRANEATAFLQRLARLVVPPLRTCFNADRFRRGDRRRDVLISVYHAVNRSLQVSAVIQAAREAMGRLEGHCVSEIALFDDTSPTLHAYRCITGPDGAARLAPDPLVRPRSESALQAIVDQRRTYESGDLRSDPLRPHEVELRTLGVRRFVAAPMFARDRVLGALLFGTTDPHPMLRLDIWLYENLALQLGLAIDNAMQHERVQVLSQRLNQQARYLQEEIRSEFDAVGMIGDSPAMRTVRDAILRVAATSTTVLITGETGVGKELVARAIHEQSGRSGQPMVKINCAAIPETMVESELFGHERGAFTSAVERRAGRFELARDSTLFLDEIGELSPAVQAKLLRVLQDGEFERVGGTKTIGTNARIVAATNRDLTRAMEAGIFRASS